MSFIYATMFSELPMYFDCIGHEEVEEYTLINEDQQIVFMMEALLVATKNFHDDNKLGEGGFGPLYKVTFAN